MAQDFTLPCAKMHAKAQVPTRATPYSAGLDLYSIRNQTIAPKTRALIAVGLQIYIPEGHYGNIVSRSGNALHRWVDVVAGIIDSDYRGEIGVVLHNHGEQTFAVPMGTRVAQMVVQPYLPVIPQEVQYGDPAATQRGAAGFGAL